MRKILSLFFASVIVCLAVIPAVAPVAHASMEDRLQTRLEELQAEYAADQQQLTELESQEDSLKGTLLRISGAIQVLEEELAKPELSESPMRQSLESRLQALQAEYAAGQRQLTELE